LLGGVCPITSREIPKDVGHAARKMKDVRRNSIITSDTPGSDNDSFFANNFANQSMSGFSAGGASMTGRSVATVDSGNVSHFFRKITRIEADAAC
jgi:hypothetical protein